MIHSFKTRIYPTAEQKDYLNQAFGIRRWTWNWAVNEYFKVAKTGKYLGSFDLQRQLNNTVVGTAGYEWLSNVNSMVRSEAFKDFGLALDAWRRLQRQSRRSPATVNPEKGKPRFKKKGKCTDSCRIYAKNDSDLRVISNHYFSTVRGLHKPRLQFKTAESIEFLKNADLKTCTFSRKAGQYFMCVTYEKANQSAVPCGTGTVGLDLGIKHLATFYDGTETKVYDVPSSLDKAEKHTERINRQLSRKTKGSKRFQKTVLRLEKAYMHEANIKKDYREKLTTELIDTYGMIKIDDFNFNGALNLKTARRALYRVGIYAFKERLQSKANERGAVILIVKPFTPTSKTCSKCGAVKKELTLGERTYTCDSCGAVIDRDANAAINVYNYC